MKKTKAGLEAAALFLMVFALGVTFGAVGNNVWNQRVSGNTPTRDQVMHDLTERLQLSAEQQKQIGAEIDDTRAKWQTLSAQFDGQHEAMRQQFRANIRAILTPEQQVKFDERIKQLDEERKKKTEKQPAH